LTFLRFQITWEAIEHAGPGIYDEAYLDYLHAVLEKAYDYGIDVFIDPHQDVWSRWTGGDGAPGWTLENIGMDLTKLDATGAAITHQMADEYARMIWLTNFYKFGAATMFTLFFAGDDLAPETKIDGMNPREYLQGHYINAMQRVAQCLADLPNVIGFDTLNEPVRGYIEVEDLTRDEPHGIISLGPSPTPLQAMALAAGHTLSVRNYEMRPWGPSVTGWVELNPDGESLWRDGYPGVWRENDVWTDEGGQPHVLKPFHFSRAHGRKIHFVDDYLRPFMRRYIEALRSAKKTHIIFLEGVPGTVKPTWNGTDPGNVAYAGHWYDGVTLFTKQFNRFFNIDTTTGGFRPVFGPTGIESMYNRQLAALKQHAMDEMNGVPTLIGEFGIPFDMNRASAYKDGDYSAQATALTMMYNAMDENLLNCTIWNYTPDNSNEHGDNWNEEDLSIFSRSQQSDAADINSGARALEAFVRPYAVATAGEPLRMTFDAKTKTFTYVWKLDPTISKPTIIYVPKVHYPHAYSVEADEGLVIEPHPKGQRLLITCTEEFAGETATITITSD
ncbi:MAG: cellulase family glycosylhydrolase, partial [Chloroflexota bacterium]